MLQVYETQGEIESKLMHEWLKQIGKLKAKLETLIQSLKKNDMLTSK